MLSGDQRIWCKSPLYTTPERQSVPSAKYFFRHAPDNVYITQLDGSAQVFCGWHAAVAYVIPFDSPTTSMDAQTALLFLDLLRAQDRDKAQTALMKLGVIREEDAPVLPGQVSIARQRTILTRLCAVSDCAENTKVFSIWEPARFFARWGLVHMSCIPASLTVIAR